MSDNSPSEEDDTVMDSNLSLQRKRKRSDDITDNQPQDENAEKKEEEEEKPAKRARKSTTTALTVHMDNKLGLGKIPSILNLRTWEFYLRYCMLSLIKPEFATWLELKRHDTSLMPDQRDKTKQLQAAREAMDAFVATWAERVHQSCQSFSVKEREMHALAMCSIDIQRDTSLTTSSMNHGNHSARTTNDCPEGKNAAADGKSKSSKGSASGGGKEFCVHFILDQFAFYRNELSRIHPTLRSQCNQMLRPWDRFNVYFAPFSAKFAQKSYMVSKVLFHRLQCIRNLFLLSDAILFCVHQWTEKYAAELQHWQMHNDESMALKIERMPKEYPFTKLYDELRRRDLSLQRLLRL